MSDQIVATTNKMTRRQVFDGIVSSIEFGQKYPGLTRSLATCASGPSGGCGMFNMTTTNQCCAHRQQPHFACQQCSFLPGCAKPVGSCSEEPPIIKFPPHGQWTVVTFTSANGACVPGYGNIQIDFHGNQRQMIDGCAPPQKIASDVASLCSNLHQTCPTNWDTVALPYEMAITVDATMSVRKVMVP